MSVLFENKILFRLTDLTSTKQHVAAVLGLQEQDFYLVQNGKRVTNDISENNNVHVVLRVCGGKGGFGSMLRAIGAQIEKTTNREACRDLSGRRLRDINEEKRLKNWIAQQAEREKETLERRKKKLEKLCEEPKFEFKDEEYDKERSALPEKVEDAVLHGLQASSSGAKRKGKDKMIVKKKKPKLWVDDELDDLSSSDDESDQDNEKKVKAGDSEDSKDSDNSNHAKQEENKESIQISSSEETPTEVPEQDTTSPSEEIPTEVPEQDIKETKTVN